MVELLCIIMRVTCHLFCENKLPSTTKIELHLLNQLSDFIVIPAPNIESAVV
jgi:hypothetical protein